MVVPLFVIALLWDRYDWSNSAWLRGREVSLPLGAKQWRIHSSALASGLIMILMGLVLAVMAVTGPVMATGGWLARLNAELQHYASVVLDWLDAVPGWLSGLVVFAALAGVVRRAVAQYLDGMAADTPEADGGPAVGRAAMASRAASDAGDAEQGDPS